MMDNKLEKAARAMYEARRFRRTDDMGSPIEWNDMAEFQREDCINQAKACLVSVADAEVDIAENCRLRDLLHRAFKHIDALLLYATSYPEDSHPKEAVAFARELSRDMGFDGKMRTDGQFRNVPSYCMPPYNHRPQPSTPTDVTPA